MNVKELGTETIPAVLLAKIQQLFRELNLFEHKLILRHRGQRYLTCCDAQAFTVYRINEKCYLPPGTPGWPVCLVTREEILDEASPSALGEDEFASGLSLPDWLRLIEKTFRE